MKRIIILVSGFLLLSVPSFSTPWILACGTSCVGLLGLGSSAGSLLWVVQEKPNVLSTVEISDASIKDMLTNHFGEENVEQEYWLHGKCHFEVFNGPVNSSSGTVVGVEDCVYVDAGSPFETLGACQNQLEFYLIGDGKFPQLVDNSLLGVPAGKTLVRHLENMACTPYPPSPSKY